jgi:hypothetical protein
MPDDDTQSQLAARQTDERSVSQLVTVESQREFDFFTGQRSERTFLKLYVEARSSGLLAAISDRDWKTLCTLATYMDANGYCYPSQTELARALGCSRQMANARVKSLAAFRFQDKPVLIVEKETRTQQGTWARNGYRVMPIASLGIFDGESQPRDGRKSRRPGWATPAEGASDMPQQTVSKDIDTDSSTSRSIDTVAAQTVSNHTVPVQLDTNKNHVTNKNQIEFSNLRKTKNSQQEREESSATGRDHLQQAQSGAALETIGETLRQRVKPRSRSNHADAYDEDRQVLLEYVRDFAREFGDRAPLKASTSRVYNLYHQSGLSRDTFIERLYQARAITKERQASIRSGRFAYFLGVLEDTLGLRDDPPTHQPSR